MAHVLSMNKLNREISTYCVMYPFSNTHIVANKNDAIQQKMNACLNLIAESFCFKVFKTNWHWKNHWYDVSSWIYINNPETVMSKQETGVWLKISFQQNLHQKCNENTGPNFPCLSFCYKSRTPALFMAKFVEVQNLGDFHVSLGH